jgi:hypothetical protein
LLSDLAPAAREETKMLTLKHRLMTAQEVRESRAFDVPRTGMVALRDALIALRLMFIRLYNDAHDREVHDSTARW